MINIWYLSERKQAEHDTGKCIFSSELCVFIELILRDGKRGSITI
jgi:hypothetical protein